MWQFITSHFRLEKWGNTEPIGPALETRHCLNQISSMNLLVIAKLTENNALFKLPIIYTFKNERMSVCVSFRHG